MYRGINLILQELHKSLEIFSVCGAVDQRGPLSVFHSHSAFVFSFLLFLCRSQKIHIKQKLVAHPHHSIISQLTGLFLACLLSAVMKDSLLFCDFFSNFFKDVYIVKRTPAERWCCEDLLVKKNYFVYTSTNIKTQQVVKLSSSSNKLATFHEMYYFQSGVF